MTGIQIAFIRLLQTQAAWLAAPMLLFSLLGQPEFFLLIIAYLYWCSNPRLGLRLGLLMGISGGLNEALKVAFHLPRPYWVSSEVRALAPHPSFGLPSGHAQGAVTFWGLLAATARRRWFSLLAATLIVFIGISRVFLGAHFPTDIITGVMLGLAILIGFLTLEGPVGRRIAALPISGRLLLAFAGSIVLVLASSVAFAAIGGWQVPAVWAEGAIQQSGQPIDPLDPTRSATVAGFFFGFAAGAAVEWPRGMGICTAGGWSGHLLRYAFGITVAGTIWLLFGLLVPPESVMLAHILQYTRAAATAAWISYGAPVVFARMHPVGRA